MPETDAMTADRYDEEVRMRAEDAAQSLSSAIGRPQPEEALDEKVSGIVDHHNWFARSYYDIHLYASVLQHAHTSGTEMPHDDWQHRVAEQSAAENGIRQMAKDFFEQDVWEAALERLPDDSMQPTT